VKPSNCNCWTRPDREKDVYARYSSAFLAACSFQSTLRLSTAKVASEVEKPSYSNCLYERDADPDLRGVGP
jgi:hypothetical protein